MIKNKIINYLKEIERSYNIEILLACETGSRAWGFPSPDSDYDIRIIFKHPPDWYLSLSEPKDSIELMLEENVFDISGWDIRKSLRLLAKSNPPLLERIYSPEIYLCNEQFLTQIKEYATNCYSRIATMHHYLNMSKKAILEIDGKTNFSLKKLFYALRAALVCKWIIEKEEIPPVQFSNILQGLSIDSTLKNQIESLISLKNTRSETYFHVSENKLVAFIHQILNDAELLAKKLPASKVDTKSLNHFFRQTIQLQK